MKRRSTRKKHYVGKRRSTGKLGTFTSVNVPTEEQYGREFAYVIGPFKTVGAAEYMAAHGMNNPHLRSVEDAERIVRELTIRGQRHVK
jgi:hypothetical protein